MAEELLSLKEKIRKELEEVKGRIAAHEILAEQCESKLLEVKGKPRTFGELEFPELEEPQLTEADRLRLRSAALISKQKIGKFLGIRICDYKHDPQQFVVEFNVTSNKGMHVGPFFAAFKKNTNGSYRVIKSKLPHVIVMLETEAKYPLEDDQQLSAFVRELRLCCEAYVDRRDQVVDLLEVINKQMVTKISYDEGYLFLELTIILDKNLMKLQIFYHHNRVLPYKFFVDPKGEKVRKTWTEAFKVLHKCRLVDALELMVVKIDDNTDSEIDSPVENVGTDLPPQKPHGMTKSISKKDANKPSKSRTAKKAKKTGDYNFSDSSNDEANRSTRMRKKKAKISSNIRRKTLWAQLSLPASQETASKDRLSADDSEVSSNNSKETHGLGKNADGKKKKSGEKKTSREGATGKQSQPALRKRRQVRVKTPPPSVPDSELSNSELSNSELSNSELSEDDARKRKRVQSPVSQRSPKAKSFLAAVLSPETPSSPSTRLKRKQPLLAAIFHKARQSLQKSSSESPEEPAETVQVKTVKKKAETSNEQAKISNVPAKISVEPAPSPAKTSAKNDNVKTSSTKLAKQNDQERKQSPPKDVSSEVSNSDEQTFSSNASPQSSGQLLSEVTSGSTSTIPLKLTRLKSNSQESGVGKSETASGESVSGTGTEKATTKGGLAMSKAYKDIARFKAARVSLPVVHEVDPLRKSPRKRDRETDGESGVGSKKGGVQVKETGGVNEGKKAASVVDSKKASSSAGGTSVTSAPEAVSIKGKRPKSVKMGKVQAVAIRKSPRRVEGRRSRRDASKQGSQKGTGLK